VAGVHLEDRRAAKVAGLGALEPGPPQRGDQRGRTAGVLEWIDDLPMHHVLLWLMRQLRFVEEQLHEWDPGR
jgi:hypothetical protein